MDYCRAVMGITEFPQAISASGGKLFFDDAQEWPDTQIVTFDFPGKIITYEMRIWSEPRLLDQGEAGAVYGDKGWVLINNSTWKGYDGDGKILAQIRVTPRLYVFGSPAAKEGTAYVCGNDGSVTAVKMVEGRQ